MVIQKESLQSITKWLDFDAKSDVRIAKVHQQYYDSVHDSPNTPISKRK